MMSIGNKPTTGTGAKTWEREIDLTRAAANEDRQAQCELVSRLMYRVRRLSVYLAGRSWEPEDLAQTALIEILRSAGSFRGDSSLNRWADRVTVHTAYKRVEKFKRRETLWNHKRPDLDDGCVSEEMDVESIGVSRRMATLLGSLSEERRTAMVLHHIQGYGITEIAEMTDTLPNTVRDRLQVGRKQLRKKILADPLLCEWGKARWTQ